MLALGWSSVGRAQGLYYPPVGSGAWATESPASLGIQADRIDSLYAMLESRGTKGFILLHRGRIVLERYFGGFRQDSLHYWASAGKTLTASAIGLAQADGRLHIDSAASRYLGAGWTSLTPAQERAITVRHMLTMTTGLEDNVPDLNCRVPACLTFRTAPGNRWAYHNAPYLLLQDVVARATGVPFGTYVRQRITTPIGGAGLWFDGVHYSRVRDAARFGLLMHGQGRWGSTRLLDSAYVAAATRPSQTLNPAYGYLWWLNGQSANLSPRVNLLMPGPIIPEAPNDVIAALGKNDQKIYVAPSLGYVVVRFGDPAGASAVLALSSFDQLLWQYIMALRPATSLTGPRLAESLPAPYPNPTTTGRVTIPVRAATPYRIVDSRGLVVGQGRTLTSEGTAGSLVDLGDLAPGVYRVMAGAYGGQVIRHPGR